MGVGENGEGEAVGGEESVEFAEGEAGLDVNQAIVSVELAEAVEFFHADNETGGEVSTGAGEAGTTDGNWEGIFFLG